MFVYLQVFKLFPEKARQKVSFPVNKSLFAKQSILFYELGKNLKTEFISPAAVEKSVIKAVSGVMYRFARVVLSDTQYASIEPESNCPICMKSLSYT